MLWYGGLSYVWFFFLTCNNHTIDLKWIVPEAPLKIIILERLHVRRNLLGVRYGNSRVVYGKPSHSIHDEQQIRHAHWKHVFHLFFKIKSNVCIALFVCNSIQRHSIHSPPQRLVDKQKYPPLCKTISAFGWWRVLISHPGEYKKATIHLWGAAVFQSDNLA